MRSLVTDFVCRFAPDQLCPTGSVRGGNRASALRLSLLLVADFVCRFAPDQLYPCGQRRGEPGLAPFGSVCCWLLISFVVLLLTNYALRAASEGRTGASALRLSLLLLLISFVVLLLTNYALRAASGRTGASALRLSLLLVADFVCRFAPDQLCPTGSVRGGNRASALRSVCCWLLISFVVLLLTNYALRAASEGNRG